MSMSWKLLIIVIIGGLIYYYLIKYLSVAISYKAGSKKKESGQKERVIISEYTTGIKQIRVFETFSSLNLCKSPDTDIRKSPSYPIFKQRRRESATAMFLGGSSAHIIPSTPKPIYLF